MAKIIASDLVKGIEFATGGKDEIYGLVVAGQLIGSDFVWS